MSPDLTRIVAYGLMACSVLGACMAVWWLIQPARPGVRRLRRFTETPARDKADPLILRTTLAPGPTTPLARLATTSDPDRLSLVRLNLVQAGFQSPKALEIYSAVRVMLTLTFPVAAWFSLPDMKMVWVAGIVLLTAGLGYYLPAGVVVMRADAHRRALLRGLPDALDLLVSSVEAGLGLDAALARVGEKIAGSAPELSRELQIAQTEILAGRPRVDALRRLGRRTGLAAVNSLVNVLVQADQFGTPVAQALRVHSTTVRARRMLDAEEKAAQISPKLTVAMILFLLPPLFVVILGPAVVRIVRELIPTMSGG